MLELALFNFLKYCVLQGMSSTQLLEGVATVFESLAKEDPGSEESEFMLFDALKIRGLIQELKVEIDECNTNYD